MSRGKDESASSTPTSSKLNAYPASTARRARLDALFFLLYGIDRDDADYILSTFPILREQEQAAYGGRFRSRDLILNTMAALQAGHPDAPVAG